MCVFNYLQNYTIMFNWRSVLQKNLKICIKISTSCPNSPTSQHTKKTHHHTYHPPPHLSVNYQSCKMEI